MLEDTINDFVKLMGVLVTIVAVAAAMLAPWLYHIVWCIKASAETGGAIALLIVGVLFPPLGWVHGVCLTFGATWI